MSESRISRLLDLMTHQGLDALVLNPGPSLIYLTGLDFHLSERPTTLLVTPRGCGLVVPQLELLKAAQSRIPLQTFPFGDNPAEWGSAFQRAVQTLGLEGKTLGAEPIRLRFLEMQYLQAAAPLARLVSAEEVFYQLRMQKDAEEVAAMRRAVKIAQAGLEATLPFLRAGRSEREVAGELVAQLLRAGSDPLLPFQPIVSGGPNSANPHAVPGERLLQAGDLLVIDWGASYQGYFSDLTRTFVLGAPNEEQARIAGLVEGANAAGRAAGRPGLRAGDVDVAARKVITAGGYGEFFTHRTGHGLGMESHEPPYMFEANNLILAEGMTYTVEPGIYLPGKGGVRIEDDMVVTANGCESLSDMPRALAVLPL